MRDIISGDNLRAHGKNHIMRRAQLILTCKRYSSPSLDYQVAIEPHQKGESNYAHCGDYYTRTEGFQDYFDKQRNEEDSPHQYLSHIKI